MKYKDDLKIEFRAVPYASEHVLEYRISPDQDLTYYNEYSFLKFFTFRIKKKYDTNWNKAWRFLNYVTAYRYPESEVDPHPIFIYKQTDLESFKINFPTIGQFFKYLDDISDKEREKYKKAREKYLKDHTVWY